MTFFRVWAPEAKTVSLEWQQGPTPLTRGQDGYFEADLSLATAGMDYRFVVDDGKPLADPRSAFQPTGIHGPSRVVDHEAFVWEHDTFDAKDFASLVFYELHVGTFSKDGTFDGVVPHLDALVELGVNAIELMPVSSFSGERGWGYDGVFLFSPHAPYGSPESLKRLVDACHARGIAVFLDVVYNHVGPAGNVLPAFGPYFTDRYATPWGRAPNFDGADSGPVRDFVCDNALMWLRDYRMDGLRIDAVHAIVDLSAVHILEELGERVNELSKSTGRTLHLVAESDLNDPRVVAKKDAGGYGLTAQWSDDLHHAIHAALTGERSGYYRDFGTVSDLATALTDVFVYAGRFSEHRRRVHGRSGKAIPSHRFVVFQQNHDQIGNRAEGERSAELLRPGLAKVAAALVLTSPFVPLLFQGEEWAASTPFLYFTDHRDEELSRAVRDGRAREFGFASFASSTIPDPESYETFGRSKLDWSERNRKPHSSMLEWYRDLLRLRREHPALRGARVERPRVTFDEKRRSLVVERENVRVAFNLSPEPIELRVPAAGKVLLSSDPESRAGDGFVRLAAESVFIFEA